MIKVSKELASLSNLGITFDAIRELNKVIKVYSEDKPGPSYVKFYYTDTKDMQIDRAFMLECLKQQRQKLVDYLKTLNIDYDL